jgi:hypothetical protein
MMNDFCELYIINHPMDADVMDLSTVDHALLKLSHSALGQNNMICPEHRIGD